MHPASFPSSSPLRSPRALYKHPNAAPQLAGLTPEGVRQWQTDERHAHESGLVTMDEGGLEVFWATKVNAENGLCPAAWTRRPPPQIGECLWILWAWMERKRESAVGAG